MKTKLLYVASGFTLFTFLGHTAGQFMPIPPDQTQRLQVFEVMQKPVIIMPMGGTKSFAEFLSGANLSLSVYLLVTGICLFLFAKNYTSQQRPQLFLHSLGLAMVALISARYFFPLPAICLGVAAILGFVSFKAEG